MKITIIGLGLLGGSFALGYQEKRDDLRIVGVDNNDDNAHKAKELGLVDEVCGLNQAIENTDMIVLATPVNILTEQLAQVLDAIADNTLVIDFGSTKELICQSVQNHPNRGQYVAMHPIAGTENSGPEAAFSKLLHNQTMIICEKEKSAPAHLRLAEEIFGELNMHLLYMSAEEHDRHIAYVSHLSHISSFALSTTVLEIEKDERSISNLAGSGFSSTVRLAKSSPEMWAPIFAQNTPNISKALGAYIEHLQNFKQILDNEDEESSKSTMKAANEIRRILDGIDGKD